MERLFDLDFQLLFDGAVLAVSVFAMSVFLSYFLFQPVRAALKARQERIAKDAQTAEHEKEEARKLKMTYEEKIKSIEEEAQEIMFRARQKALKSEQDMLKKAGREAEWIKEKAKIQIELERKKEADEKKKEMISVACALAQKVMKLSATPQIQDELVEETLKEIGERTWIRQP